MLAAAARRVIVPAGKTTTLNGEVLQPPVMLACETGTLPTELADDDGVVRRTTRRTELRMYEPRPGEVATLFELGIPVMETGDAFHVDVQQKVPLRAWNATASHRLTFVPSGPRR